MYRMGCGGDGVPGGGGVDTGVNFTYSTRSPKIATEKVIQIQLAKSTCPPGFSLNVIISITMCIILVLFVLFLPVICIWVDLQVPEIWDFGSTLKSRQATLSRAKPSQQCDKPAGGCPVTVAEGGC
jgi:hypothetical protein